MWSQRKASVVMAVAVLVMMQMMWYGYYGSHSDHVVHVVRVGAGVVEREEEQGVSLPVLPSTLAPWKMSREERAKAVELLGYGAAEELKVPVVVEEESPECVQLKANPLVQHRIVCVLLAMWPEEIAELELVYQAWGHECDGFYIPVPAPHMESACNWCRARPGWLFCPGEDGGEEEDDVVDPCAPFASYDPPEGEVTAYHDHIFRTRGVLRGILEPEVVDTWDYVLKTDVDSFIGVVNLRRVVASARADVPDYRGYVFTAWWDVDNIVWAGGGGYVLSKAGLLAIDLDGARVLDKAGEDNFMGLAARDAGVVLNRMADALHLQRVVNVMPGSALDALVSPLSPFPVALHKIKLPLEDRREIMMSWAQSIGRGLPVQFMGMEEVNGLQISSIRPIHDTQGILNPLAYQEPYLTPAFVITYNEYWLVADPETWVYDLYLNSCNSDPALWHFPDNTPGLSPTCHTTAPVADCRLARSD